MGTALFVITGLMAVGAAVKVVTEKNAVHAALFLILNIISLAVIYLLLGAEFVAAIQVIVYAGAIMVLFLYVAMLSGEAATPEGPDRLAWQRRIAVGAGLILAALIYRAAAESGQGHAVSIGAIGGSPAEVGRLLFTRYALPFEIASLLLLIAMVGAIALAKRR
jgi:NADH-quinone oxidoreductase subunit J